MKKKSLTIFLPKFFLTENLVKKCYDLESLKHMNCSDTKLSRLTWASETFRKLAFWWPMGKKQQLPLRPYMLFQMTSNIILAVMMAIKKWKSDSSVGEKIQPWNMRQNVRSGVKHINASNIHPLFLVPTSWEQKNIYH